MCIPFISFIGALLYSPDVRSALVTLTSDYYFPFFFFCFFLGSSLTTLPVAGRLDYVKAWLLTSVLCCKREVSLICFGIMRSPFSLATLCLSTAFVLLSYLQSFSPWNAPPSVPKYILLVIWLLGKCWWTELYYGFFFFFSLSVTFFLYCAF